jgi:hypothetical protein
LKEKRRKIRHDQKKNNQLQMLRQPQEYQGRNCLYTNERIDRKKLLEQPYCRQQGHAIASAIDANRAIPLPNQVAPQWC